MRLQSTFSQNSPPPNRSSSFFSPGLLALQDHVALLHQPGIQVDRLAPRVEAVIRHDQHRRPWIDVLEHLADELIGAPIDALDRVAELSRQRRVVHRVLRDP